jgi:hypothetical protein
MMVQMARFSGPSKNCLSLSLRLAGGNSNAFVLPKLAKFTHEKKLNIQKTRLEIFAFGSSPRMRLVVGLF